MRAHIADLEGTEYDVEVTFGDLSRAKVSEGDLGDPVAMMRVLFQGLKRQGDIGDVGLADFLDRVPFAGVDIDFDADPSTGE